MTPYLLLSLIAIAINIPCGFIRQGHPKFSGKWFLWIHASIPILIFLRISWQTSAFFIIPTIALAILGQMIGSRIRESRMTKEEKAALAQIPKLKADDLPIIKDSDVTIALLNMGGPKTNDDVEDFQKRLFEDPILIRFPLSFLLQKVFAKLLIALRLKAVKERYHLIGGGSPIYPSTENQVKALKSELERRGRQFDVTYSFNYSPPLPHEIISHLKRQNKKYLLPLSLYPHYSKATTGSNLHYLNKEKESFYPELQLLEAPSYHLHPGYIQSFIDRINEQIKEDETLDDFYLIFSAHGLPLYFLNEGDPYPFLISQTVAQIVGALKRDKDWVISYQSAVGPLQWLKPSTDDILLALARQGIQKVLIVPISFVGDHIETTCEIDIEYRQLAQEKGIKDFRMSKAIESHPKFIEALADTIEKVLTPKSETTKNTVFNNQKIGV